LVSLGAVAVVCIEIDARVLVFLVAVLHRQNRAGLGDFFHGFHGVTPVESWKTLTRLPAKNFQ